MIDINVIKIFLIVDILKKIKKYWGLIKILFLNFYFFLILGKIILLLSFRFFLVFCIFDIKVEKKFILKLW